MGCFRNSKLCTSPNTNSPSCWRVRPADCSLGAEALMNKLRTNQEKGTYPYFKRAIASDRRHFPGDPSTELSLGKAYLVCGITMMCASHADKPAGYLAV